MIACDAAARVLERCDELARCSGEPGRITRLFATPAARAAAGLVEGWMRDAGLAVRRDAVGNVIGRWPGTGGARTLVIGSHLDSVRDAGRFDGPLGILGGLAAVEVLRERACRLPFAVDVVAFADEEGVRFGTAYLGSSALVGTFDPRWLQRRDAEGTTMRDAIVAAGGDPDAIARERRDPSSLVGYCELHIEQGPVLEQADIPVGVVTGIAGQTRAQATFTGAAGHAGTVPMHARSDALCAAADWIVGVERLARGQDGLVATTGELSVAPGASNVVPGRVQASLDVRHVDDDTRRVAHADAQAIARRAATERRAQLDWSVVQETPAVACSPALTSALAAAVAAAGVEAPRLPSGAGHDAAALAAVTGVAMLFVRCAGGISHSPDEHVDVDDVAVAITVLAHFVETLAGHAA